MKKILLNILKKEKDNIKGAKINQNGSLHIPMMSLVHDLIKDKEDV
jgi:hypothetical protein